jgi:hypothetical protein
MGLFENARRNVSQEEGDGENSRDEKENGTNRFGDVGF